MEEKHTFTAFFKRAVSPMLVLHILKDGPMYGYQINQTLNQLTNKKLGLALLYPVLYKLEADGHIQETETVIEKGRARTYFGITPSGLVYLEKTTGEFRDLAATALAMLDGRTAP